MEWMEVVDVINRKTENFKNCVYMWRNKVNGKLYVGITRKFIDRTQQHKRASFNKNRRDYYYPLHDSIRKYGIENFEICILEKNLSYDEMRDKEDFYIEKYDTLAKNKKGYNLATSGGSNNPYAGKTPEEMEEIGKKISEANKGEKNHNYGKKGENNPIYGKKQTEETKRKKSEALKGKNSGEKHPQCRKIICVTTEEVFNYIKQASEKYGVAHQHISRCCHGKRNSAGKDENGNKLVWMYLEDYQKLSKEEIDKIKNEEVPNGSKLKNGSRSKAVICITTGKTYKSVREASRQTGVQGGDISACCREKRKSAGKDENGNKLEWMFLEDYLKSLK